MSHRAAELERPLSKRNPADLPHVVECLLSALLAHFRASRRRSPDEPTAVAERPTRELVANGIRGPHAAPVADFAVARARAAVAGLNGSGFGRKDSAKQREAGTMTAILEARTAQDSETPATPVFAAPIQHP